MQQPYDSFYKFARPTILLQEDIVKPTPEAMRKQSEDIRRQNAARDRTAHTIAKKTHH